MARWAVHRASHRAPRLRLLDGGVASRLFRIGVTGPSVVRSSAAGSGPTAGVREVAIVSRCLEWPQAVSGVLVRDQPTVPVSGASWRCPQGDAR